MTISANITQPDSASRDALNVDIAGAVEFRGNRVEIELWAADSIEVSWLASAAADVDDAGNVRVSFVGIQVERETAVWVNAIASSELRYRFETVEPSVMKPSDLAVGEIASQTMARLAIERANRFEVPIGDPGAVGAREHRLVYAIDRLLVTSDIAFPGGVVLPVDSRPNGSEERRLMDRAVRLSGWQSSVPETHWSSHYALAHPWTAITFPNIWAADHRTADRLAQPIRDDVLGLLALNRGARGRVVGVVIEARADDDTVTSKVRLELPGYQGNLIGGLFAGESQAAFAMQMRGMSRDPLLKLAVKLYGEALFDASVDARYFRLWAILETLATSRVGGNQRVFLEDGAPWQGNATTNTAAPRVYFYLRQLGVGDHVPAPDLYTAVRAWYGRRNATAHRGRFDPSDRGPASNAAFAFTLFTPVAGGEIDDPWLAALSRTTKAALHVELQRVGQPGFVADAPGPLG